MSNELLRIHDENNNCDLVAVANPMGNFHMSTYAEMQDGTQKPVDGWYLFSKMIEKLGQGGNVDAQPFTIKVEKNDNDYVVVEPENFNSEVFGDIYDKYPNVIMMVKDKFRYYKTYPATYKGNGFIDFTLTIMDDDDESAIGLSQFTLFPNRIEEYHRTVGA